MKFKFKIQILHCVGLLFIANVAFSAEAKIKWQWVNADEKVENFDNWEPSGIYKSPNDSKEPYAEMSDKGRWQNHHKDSDGEHRRPGAYESNIDPQDKALNWIQWKKSDGGNDHWYAITSKNKNAWRTWKEHETYSLNVQAYLATITTVEENNFINNLRKKADSYDTFIGLYGTKENDTEEKEKEPTGPKYVRGNYTGRVLGVPPPINSTASTNSPQSGGSYSRISLRNRTRIN